MKWIKRLAAISVVPIALLMFFVRRRDKAAAGKPHWRAVMGGTAIRPVTLSAGFATAAMGGLELDLRETALEAHPATLDVGVFSGGLLLRVPDSWGVQLDVHPTLGGVRDFREEVPQGKESADLVVSGSVTMGGFALVAGDMEIEALVTAAANAEGQH